MVREDLRVKTVATAKAQQDQSPLIIVLRWLCYRYDSHHARNQRYTAIPLLDQNELKL